MRAIISLPSKLCTNSLFLASQMAQAILENQAPWITWGFGFKNIADFQQRVSSIPTLGGGWRSAYVVLSVAAEDWVPVEILFWMRDALAVVKDLIGDETLAKNMNLSGNSNHNYRVLGANYSSRDGREFRVLRRQETRTTTIAY